MKILAIETSCDETAAAVTDGRKVISSAIYSQILLHKKWGGVVPSIAKKAHQERIDIVILEALFKATNSKFEARSTKQIKNSNLENSNLFRISDFDIRNSMKSIDFIAVTYGPGLAIALEVGIEKAKELAKKHNKNIVPVNHMEGHIYANFAQNSAGNPVRPFTFPYLALLVSGNHTEIVLWEDHLKYKILGATLDDAAGEALDKAARMLDLGYPGGHVIERLSKKVNNKDFYKFPRPMRGSNDLNFSFSGLKTSIYYYLMKNSKTNIKQDKLEELASSFQEAVFDSILIKMRKAIEKTGISNIAVGGGVIANKRLRNLLRALAKSYKGKIVFPAYKYLCTDNAAMIGVAAHYKAKAGIFVKNIKSFEREPRLVIG
jgi:N6-L-threonylcarbamoyladenine synthase